MRACSPYGEHVSDSSSEDFLVERLAEAGTLDALARLSRRHRGIVTVTIGPYEPDEDGR